MTDQASSTASDFELMDREDEEQILAELRGVPVEKFIYLNKKTGKNELTYAGTKWVVRQMAELGEAIRIDGHPKVDRCMIDPEWITCTVLGRRVKINVETRTETVLDTNIGASRGWIKQKTNSGIIPDEFFFNKTCSKAVRNLQQSLIPTDLLKKMLDTLVAMQGRGGSQQQRPPQGQQPSQGAQQQKPEPSQQQQKPPAQPPKQEQQSQKPAEQPKPPAQQTKQTQQQSTQPKPQNAGNSPVTLEAIQHGFRAVFIQFTKTEDKTTNQKALKALTGKTAITDLERELMVELGPLLRQAINGKVKWNGTSIHDIATGEQLWPKVQPQAEPEPTPRHEEAPPPQEEPMF